MCIQVKNYEIIIYSLMVPILKVVIDVFRLYCYVPSIFLTQIKKLRP